MSGTLLRFCDYQKELQYDVPTLKAALDHLVAQYPDVGKALLDKTGQLRATHRLFLNGETVDKNQIDRPVTGDDVVDIMTAITGG